jgi:hypothetical protein
LIQEDIFPTFFRSCRMANPEMLLRSQFALVFFLKFPLIVGTANAPRLGADNFPNDFGPRFFSNASPKPKKTFPKLRRFRRGGSDRREKAISWKEGERGEEKKGRSKGGENDERENEERGKGGLRNEGSGKDWPRNEGLGKGGKDAAGSESKG